MNDVSDQLNYTNKIRELCMRHFMPVKTLADGKPNPDDHPGFRAEAIHAASCMVSIARVFKGIETGHPTYILPIVVDLSFGLAENPFWKQYSGVLVPVYKSCLHAIMNSKLLEADAHKTAEKEELRVRQSKQWYNLFIVAYDCLYGVAKTMEVSTLLLQEIERTN